jgi:hypothetical protein
MFHQLSSLASINDTADTAQNTQSNTDMNINSSPTTTPLSSQHTNEDQYPHDQHEHENEIDQTHAVSHQTTDRSGEKHDVKVHHTGSYTDIIRDIHHQHNDHDNYPRIHHHHQVASSSNVNINNSANSTPHSFPYSQSTMQQTCSCTLEEEPDADEDEQALHATIKATADGSIDPFKYTQLRKALCSCDWCCC